MLKIEMKKPIKFEQDDLASFISFNYSDSLVMFMREQPRRFYHKELGLWEIPEQHMDLFLQSAKKAKIKYKFVGKKWDENRHNNIRTPKGFKYKTKPYDHQRMGLKNGLIKTKWILGDQQGLGKTKQIIDIAVAMKLKHGFKHTLIICGVNGLKWNWLSEIGIHSHEKGKVVGARLKGNRWVADSIKPRLEDLNSDLSEYFLIINIESLRNVDIVKRLKQMCDDGEIGMIAVDEIHKTKNPSSAQGMGLLELQAKIMIAMTGTPIINKPIDAFILFKWLGYEGRSYYAFKNYHCIMNGYAVVGYKHIGEIRTLLKAIMLRRLKSEALDLPDKVRKIDYVDMYPKQVKLYKEVMANIIENIDKVALNPNPLAELNRLRQVTGAPSILSSTITQSAKLDRCMELIEEVIENDEKVIIFSQWTSVTDVLEEMIKKVGYRYGIITGKVGEAERHEAMQEFQTNDNCKIMIGTVGAMGTGLTLTAANNVIFLDSPWNRATKEQAEDRAHRIGTKKVVSITTIVCKDTIDEDIEELVRMKGAVADRLVDGVRPREDDLKTALKMLLGI